MSAFEVLCRQFNDAFAIRTSAPRLLCLIMAHFELFRDRVVLYHLLLFARAFSDEEIDSFLALSKLVEREVL